jgi:penicillin amidase
LIASLGSNRYSIKKDRGCTSLKSWTGSNNLNDIGPTIYNKWIYYYLKSTFEDELDGFEQFEHPRHETSDRKSISKFKFVWWII